ncbi:CLUMA_CG006833, isoform A [Clunio marinus]|uniref:CLUMA_CG006833, isoform A n=1 Tax=Clunio marinus TaxID=568069 RepID=A0A1J1I0I7_9DIPT|nr:CLUMA_CG006833, isoform A [Clunio marinus]
MGKERLALLWRNLGSTSAKKLEDAVLPRSAKKIGGCDTTGSANGSCGAFKFTIEIIYVCGNEAVNIRIVVEMKAVTT